MFANTIGLEVPNVKGFPRSGGIGEDMCAKNVGFECHMIRQCMQVKLEVDSTHEGLVLRYCS